MAMQHEVIALAVDQLHRVAAGVFLNFKESGLVLSTNSHAFQYRREAAY